VSKRRVRIVLLCEDSQHESFVRRFLKAMGWETREMRVEKNPPPPEGGAADQWVRERFPKELSEYRQRRQRAASALVTVFDADVRSLAEREDQLRESCRSAGVPFRDNRDSVAIVIAKRNVETWIRYLEGTNVDEETPYPKLQRERDCKGAVDRLLELCRTSGLPQNAPTSLAAACDEYTSRIKPLEN
jgi:hypothetical protein